MNARKTLGLMLIITLGPVLVANWLFQTHYTGKTTQQGRWVQPALHTQSIPKKSHSPHLAHRWHLVYLQPHACQADCAIVLRQFQQIINVHQTEQQRLAISIWTTRDHLKYWQENLKSFPFETELFTLKKPILHQLLRRLTSQSNTATIALIDPNGILPLTYDSKHWPIRLNHDLKKLLKVSQAT